jgi:hypothetical protein
MDYYHDLTIGPCSPEESDAWEDHPWIEVIGMTEPGWDCDYATWAAEFQAALPATPFTLASSTDAEAALPQAGSEWSAQLRVEQSEDGWVIRNECGDYWCDALTNGWTREPDEDPSMLTFSSRAEAIAAYLQAERMYGERAARHELALSRLGLQDDNE